jgi:hypothetical protein
MTPEEVQRLKAATQEIAAILYKNTPLEAVASLEGIEKTVRTQMLEHVSPEIALFYPCRLLALKQDDPGK